MNPHSLNTVNIDDIKIKKRPPVKKIDRHSQQDPANPQHKKQGRPFCQVAKIVLPIALPYAIMPKSK